MIAGQAVLIAIGVDWDGRRQVLGVELANRESRSSWRDFLLGLRERGLQGIGELSAAGPRALRRDSRELAGSAPLPEHGLSARAEEGGAP